MIPGRVKDAMANDGRQRRISQINGLWFIMGQLSGAGVFQDIWRDRPDRPIVIFIDFLDVDDLS